MSKKLTPTEEAICACADFSTAITKKDKEYIRVLEANHRIKSDNLQATKKELEEVKTERDELKAELNNLELERDSYRIKLQGCQNERDELRKFARRIAKSGYWHPMRLEAKELLSKHNTNGKK